MKTIKEITGLERPLFELHLDAQKDKERVYDDFDEYVANLDAYALSLENYIKQEEQKKEGDINILYNNLKDLEKLNGRAIDLNCDVYLKLEEALGVNYDKTNKSIYDALHEQWYDVLKGQERIIMRLQNYINSKEREEQNNGKGSTN